MSHRTWPGKQLLLLLSILVAVMACQKQGPAEEDNTEVPPTNNAAFESLFTIPKVSVCGDPYTSDLKIKNGNNIGSVTVSNDGSYLYLTYELKDNWYLVDMQTYAGPKDLLPKEDVGSPDHTRFPGKQAVSPCDMKQTFTFRVTLASLTAESEADCAARYFTAMRATVRHIPNIAGCSAGRDEEAWAAPIVINPGRNWATAFYYCRQDCPPPPPAWCAFGQGYWFASGKHDWCGDAKVTFGSLVVTQQEGVDLWDKNGKRSTLEKAFFQASALQLSMNCMNEGRPIPDKNIEEAYLTILNKLSGYTKVQELNAQLNAEDEKLIQDALGAIGKWICANNCDKEKDPTACAQ